MVVLSGRWSFSRHKCDKKNICIQATTIRRIDKVSSWVYFSSSLKQKIRTDSLAETESRVVTSQNGPGLWTQIRSNASYGTPASTMAFQCIRSTDKTIENLVQKMYFNENTRLIVVKLSKINKSKCIFIFYNIQNYALMFFQYSMLYASMLF